MAASATVPARWTDLPRRRERGAASGRARRRRRRGGCSLSGWSGCGRGVRVRGGASVRKRRWSMSGQLALAVSEEAVVAAAVWETLPAERRSAR